MTTLPIPKIYWDVFQGALQTKVRRLVKEVAESLGQPEQPLMKALAGEKVEAYLFEEEGSEFLDLPSMRCKHLVPSTENKAVLMLCRQPVLLGQSACLLHQSIVLKKPPTLPVLRTMKDSDTGDLYWVDAMNSVREKSMISEAIGIYVTEAKVLRIFNVESS
jgi:hypothetical protein